MRITKNRLKILELLEYDEWEHEVGIPPFSTSTLKYILDSDEIKQSVQQIHRTLRDLEGLGIIEHTTRISTDTGNPLPQKIKEYAVMGRMDYWLNRRLIISLEHELKQHYEGINIFGSSCIKKELKPKELEEIECELEVLRLKTCL